MPQSQLINMSVKLSHQQAQFSHSISQFVAEFICIHGRPYFNEMLIALATLLIPEKIGQSYF